MRAPLNGVFYKGAPLNGVFSSRLALVQVEVVFLPARAVAVVEQYTAVLEVVRRAEVQTPAGECVAAARVDVAPVRCKHCYVTRP